MKNLPRFAWLTLFLVSMSAAAADFRDHLGLQLWSLRTQLKDNIPAALDLAKSYGVKEVEAYAIPGITIEDLAKELKSRGLSAVSMHTGYGDLERDVAEAIRNAKILGAKFIVCPYPKLDASSQFTEVIAREMAANFNTWGEACRKEGIRLGFHPHGLEFRPLGGAGSDTVFDVLVRETKPELVSFQMDVFWVFHAGQDPVKLLAKHPGRWVTMHIKDMRKGALTGIHTGTTAATDKVTVGTGQMDWPAILRAGQKAGLKHYFLEDETPAPLQCIPDSFKYLRALKL